MNSSETLWPPNQSQHWSPLSYCFPEVRHQVSLHICSLDFTLVHQYTFSFHLDWINILAQAIRRREKNQKEKILLLISRPCLVKKKKTTKQTQGHTHAYKKKNHHSSLVVSNNIKKSLLKMNQLRHSYFSWHETRI